MSKLINLLGIRFNKLVVLGISSQKRLNGGPLWRCLCDCGKEVDARSECLRSKITKSCGKDICRHDFINLTGHKYGKLTVLGFEKVRKSNRHWKCLCECGDITYLSSYLLTKGKVISCSHSCGGTLPNNQAIVNRAYRSHLAMAKSRDIVSYLTIEEYSDIAKKPCVYCQDISIRKHIKNGTETRFNSVDRKNNEKSYKISNSQSTCFVCQRMKMDMTHEEFLKQIKKINKFYEDNNKISN